MAGWQAFDGESGIQYRPGVIEVKFKDGVPEQRIVEFINGINESGMVAGFDGSMRSEARFTFDGPMDFTDPVRPLLGQFVSVHVENDRRVDETIVEIWKSVDVELAARAPAMTGASYAPDDEMIGNSTNPAGPNAPEKQWYLVRCRASEVWAQNINGTGVVVADIDWGFRVTHKEIAGRYEVYQPLPANSNAINDIAHGTGVVGLIGARAFNGGMCGFSWGAALWLIQAGTAGENFGQVVTNSWAQGVENAAGAHDPGGRRRVINIEAQTGGGGNVLVSIAVRGAVERALSRQVIVCIAAGNGSLEIAKHVKAVPKGAILVGATLSDPNNRLTNISNWGDDVSVCAPGDGKHDLTCSALNDSAYRPGFGGTSGAAAKVAGAIALMLQAKKSLTPVQVQDVLKTQGGPVTVLPPQHVGGKFLDCLAAVNGARAY